MAPAQFPGGRSELIQKRVGDRFVGVNALNGNAELAAVPEAARHGARHRQIDVGIRFDDHRRVAAQLKRHALQAGRRPDGLAHRHAAREGYHRHPGIGHQLPSQRGAIAAHHVIRAFGHSGVNHGLRQTQRAQRRFFGGLVHHRVAAGQRRTDLVHGRIQRHVERGDGADNAQRFANGDRHFTLGRGCAFHRDHFAPQIAGLHGGCQQRLQRAFSFPARFLDGFPGFVDDYAREVF